MASLYSETEKNQQAAIAQGRTNRIVDLQMVLAQPAIAEAMWKANTGADDLNLTQLWQHFYYSGAAFWGWSDSFYQFKKGLMNADDYATEVDAMKFVMSSPAIRAAWKLSHAAYAKEFVEFMDRLVAEVPVRVYSADILVRWKSIFHTELSRAPQH